MTPANIQVGDGVTVNLWSDRYAATVIKVTKSQSGFLEDLRHTAQTRRNRVTHTSRTKTVRSTHSVGPENTRDTVSQEICH